MAQFRLYATNVDSNATGVQWDIEGNYSVVSGTTTDTELVIEVAEGEEVTAKVKAVGDGQNYTDSDWSNVLDISVPAVSSDCDTTNYDTSLQDGDSINGVQLTDPDQVTTLYFNSKEYNEAIAPLVGFYDVNGTTIKVDYATEYDGDTFIVEKDGTIYKSTFSETGTYDDPVVMVVCS